MGIRIRLIILFAFIVVTMVAFALAGVPNSQFGLVLAGANGPVYYYYEDDDDDSPDLPDCQGVNIDDAALGLVLGDTIIHWEPIVGSTIGTLKVLQGQTFFVLGVDWSNSWYQIVIACELVWIPVGTIAPVSEPFPTTVVGPPAPTSTPVVE